MYFIFPVITSREAGAHDKDSPHISIKRDILQCHSHDTGMLIWESFGN